MSFSILWKDKKFKYKNSSIRKLIKDTIKTLNLEKHEISFVISDENEMKKLNRKFRGKTYVPQVLSFPQNGDRFILGDVVILSSCLNNKDKLPKLLIHGILNLTKYSPSSSFNLLKYVCSRAAFL